MMPEEHAKIFKHDMDHRAQMGIFNWKIIHLQIFKHFISCVLFRCISVDVRSISP